VSGPKGSAFSGKKEGLETKSDPQSKGKKLLQKERATQGYSKKKTKVVERQKKDRKKGGFKKRGGLLPSYSRSSWLVSLFPRGRMKGGGAQKILTRLSSSRLSRESSTGRNRNLSPKELGEHEGEEVQGKNFTSQDRDAEGGKKRGASRQASVG